MRSKEFGQFIVYEARHNIHEVRIVDAIEIKSKLSIQTVIRYTVEFNGGKFKRENLIDCDVFDKPRDIVDIESLNQKDVDEFRKEVYIIVKIILLNDMSKSKLACHV